MKNINKVSVTLLVNDKAGVLSSLILKSGSLGLFYRRKEAIKLKNKTMRLTIFFRGSCECTQRELRDAFLEHSSVLKVEKIEATEIPSKLVAA